MASAVPGRRTNLVLLKAPSDRAWVGAADDPEGENEAAAAFGMADAGAATLPIRVEIWDPDETMVEQVAALTSNRTIGFAAYYSAREQYPGRTIVLRDNWGVIARWSGRRQ